MRLRLVLLSCCVILSEISCVETHDVHVVSLTRGSWEVRVLTALNHPRASGTLRPPEVLTLKRAVHNARRTDKFTFVFTSQDGRSCRLAFTFSELVALRWTVPFCGCE